MKRVLATSIMVAIFSIFGCDTLIDTEETKVDDESLFDDEDGQIILGEQLENPFTLQNMAGLMKVSTDSLTPTDLYVRFRPTSDEEYHALLADSLELWPYPLDYEIIQGGTYYIDPELEEGEAPWVYTVVKPDYQSPGIEMEVLAELYLPDEDADTTGSGLGKTMARKKPEGDVYVYDTELNDYEPARRVKVKARQWFWWKTAYTDVNGHFKINKRFNSRWGRVKISLIYENSHMEIRHFGWNWSLSDLWNALFGAYYVVGKKRVNNSITNLVINLPNGSKRAKWATVLNANEEYRDYCTTYGITKPSGKLRVYSYESSSRAGFAPMLKQAYPAIAAGTFFTILYAVEAVSLAGPIVAFMVDYFLPDITISLGQSGDLNTLLTKKTMYHELGHASHYTEVGTGYWAILGGAMATAGSPSPYGNGNSEGGGRIAITEAWGHFIGYRLISDQYGCSTSEANFCTINEIGKRSDFPFIPFGVFHDLMDTYNSNEPFDHVSGYSISQMFSILSNSANYTPVRFKNSFKSTYVPQNQQYKVDDLFEEYGY